MDLNSIPEGATVEIAFKGKLISYDESTNVVRLTTDGGDRLRITWAQSADANEDYAPSVLVSDYGWQLGDVASVRTGPQSFDSLFFQAGEDGKGWYDSLGTLKAPAARDLTLIVRGGMPVRPVEES